MNGITCNGYLTAAFQPPVHGPLGSDSLGGERVVEWLQQFADGSVRQPAFDTHGPLTSGRQALLRGQKAANAFMQLKADQAGGGEHYAVVFTGIQLRQTGLDIAAQEFHLEV